MKPRVVADDDAGRAEAIQALRDGGLVAFPTDTVYGIAVRLDAPGGVEALFRAKRRPPDRGIVLLLGEASQASAIGQWPRHVDPDFLSFSPSISATCSSVTRALISAKSIFAMWCLHCA